MKKKMIVDVDCGIDDALALVIALSYTKEWEILAITCVSGNTHLDNVHHNVLRVLNVCRQHIPVFKGCEKVLVADKPLGSSYHGSDGFGGVATEFSIGDHVERETDHASIAILKLIRQYPREITLVALAPLTNLALCQRLDPDFTRLVKEIVIMGGNITGTGNLLPAAEFNFGADPEAAQMILSEAECPVTIVPMETSQDCAVPWDWYERWIEVDTEKGKFVCKVSKESAERQQRAKRLGFSCCDLLAMALVINRDAILERMHYPVYIELHGQHTRGMMVVDKRSFVQKGGNRNVSVITKVDMDIVQDMYVQMLH